MRSVCLTAVAKILQRDLFSKEGAQIESRVKEAMRNLAGEARCRAPPGREGATDQEPGGV
jgi:hypothetical protein